MSIHFYWLKPYPLKHRNQLKIFIKSIFKKEGIKLDSVNIIFCDDSYLLQINKHYLHHDYLTDIISFELNEPGYPIMGEIYISMDRVKENANSFNVPIYNELHRIIFHGILHFCGFKDKSFKEKNMMRKKETYYLEEYFVPRGTFVKFSRIVSRETKAKKSTYK